DRLLYRQLFRRGPERAPATLPLAEALLRTEPPLLRPSEWRWLDQHSEQVYAPLLATVNGKSPSPMNLARSAFEYQRARHGTIEGPGSPALGHHLAARPTALLTRSKARETAREAATARALALLAQSQRLAVQRHPR